MSKNLQEQLSDSLLRIYNLDITKMLVQFLHGEQAALFALSIGGVLNPSELSTKLGLTRSRMSTILRSLRKKGFIKEQIDEDDRRRTNVSITKKGTDFVSERENEVLDFFNLYIEKMGKEKIEQLIKLINETTIHMKEVRVDE